MKSIFHHFQSGFMETNKNNFFGRWESDFKAALKFYKKSAMRTAF